MEILTSSLEVENNVAGSTLDVGNEIETESEDENNEDAHRAILDTVDENSESDWDDEEMEEREQGRMAEPLRAADAYVRTQ